MPTIEALATSAKQHQRRERKKALTSFEALQARRPKPARQGLGLFDAANTQRLAAYAAECQNLAYAGGLEIVEIWRILAECYDATAEAISELKNPNDQAQPRAWRAAANAYTKASLSKQKGEPRRAAFYADAAHRCSHYARKLVHHYAAEARQYTRELFDPNQEG